MHRLLGMVVPIYTIDMCLCFLKYFQKTVIRWHYHARLDIGDESLDQQFGEVDPPY